VSKRDQLWSDLTRRNPRLLDDPHFTTAGLRKFFERVYDAGFDAGTLAAQPPRMSGASGASAFEEIFGGFRR
jgi:hypothetical protein